MSTIGRWPGQYYRWFQGRGGAGFAGQDLMRAARRHGVSLSYGVNMGTSDDGRVNITDGAKVATVRALLDRP
ncbi:hypothetical protein [Aeromonas enteropelogenes]|uniref:hypothetical protein n=1 Tax=Aeromonas enteropelogenes TaxID=29489 RepID=UPI003BA34DFC